MKITNSDGKEIIVYTLDGKPAVESAISALETLYKNKRSLKPLAWSAALQLAGDDWLTQVYDKNKVTIDVDGSTTETRANKFGAVQSGGVDVQQLIIKQYSFDGLNAAIFWVVDDGKSAQNYPNR